MALVEINKNPSPRELRQFACLWLPGFLLLLGILVWQRWDRLNTAFVLVAVGFLVAALGLFSLSFARTLHLVWTTAVYPIGWTVSFSLLATVYFVVLTPVGLAMRALRRRPLNLEFNRSVKSYWTPRSNSINIDRYFRQF